MNENREYALKMTNDLIASTDTVENKTIALRELVIFLNGNFDHKTTTIGEVSDYLRNVSQAQDESYLDSVSDGLFSIVICKMLLSQKAGTKIMSIPEFKTWMSNNGEYISKATP